VSDDPERNPDVRKAPPVRGCLRAFQSFQAMLGKETQCSEITEDHVLSVLASRRGREAAFGRELFADPAWDILLELFAASLGRRRMSRADLARAVDIPESSLIRWIHALAARGLVVSITEPVEHGITFLELTDSGAMTMKRLMDYWGSAFRSI